VKETDVIRSSLKVHFHEPALDETTLPSIIGLLSELLNDLHRLHRAGDLRTGPLDESVEVWSDGDHVYIQGEMSEPTRSDIDLSIHDGTIFIRIDR
jgi:hypothetical protein